MKRNNFEELYNFYPDDIVKLKSAEGVVMISGVYTYKEINLEGTYRVAHGEDCNGLITLIELTTNKVKQVQTRKNNIKLIERLVKPVVHRESSTTIKDLKTLGVELRDF
jgi:hypothetical protein